MMVTPVIALALEGVDAIEVVRQMAGPTNGRKALPGTIRGDYSMSGQQNMLSPIVTVAEVDFLRAEARPVEFNVG